MMSDYFRFSNMMAEEAVVLTFPFADELPTGVTLAGTPTVSIEVVMGVDATPLAIFDTAQVDGSDALVAIDARAATYTGKTCDYELRVTCETTDAQTVLTRVGRILVK